MRKLFSTLAAVALCSTAAFAQDENPFMSISPESGSELSALTETVTITVSPLGKELAPDAVNVMIQPVAGYGFSQDTKEPVYYPLDNGVATLNLEKDMWGVPFNEDFYLQLIVALADEDKVPIYSEDLDDYIMGMSAYTCHDNGPAAFVKSAPNNEWQGVTFARAYKDNLFQLFYTKEVSVTGSLGTIQYFDEEGDQIEGIKAITTYEAGWSEMDGLYVVSFPYALAGYDADEISKIVIDITGVSAGQKTITLDNSAVAPQKIKKGIASGLATSVEPMNVYTVQGTLVKKNATDLSGLQPGLYVVNGKKVVVK